MSMIENITPSILPVLVFLIPAVAGLLAWALGRTQTFLARLFGFIGAAGAAVVGLMMVPPVMQGQVLTSWGLEIRVDGLSCLVSVLICLIGLAAVIYSFRYMHHGKVINAEGVDISEKKMGAFYGLTLFFLATMLWGTTTNNIIMLYVAVEATTIASGLLVAHWWDRRALEAGYKYLMLLTIGITFALFGSVLLYAAAAAHLEGVNAMLLSEIRTVATLIPHSVMVFVMALFIVGFGTKAGIAPFHPWLPDAHAEAPGPVSALLSGVMIKMAAYAMARTLGLFLPSFDALGLFIVILGAFTMLLGGIMCLAQNDLKRLLAYSSVSQMGYIVMGIGFWTYLGAYGSLFHIVNHALAKTLLFLTVGAIICRTTCRRLDQMGGLAAKMPLTAACFFIGAFAISGMPPFNGFMSKFTIFAAGAEKGLWWAVAIGIFTSLLTLVALVKAGYLAFWGKPRDKAVYDSAEEVPASMLIPFTALAFGCIYLGVWPQSIFPLLDQAVRSLLGLG